MKKQRMKHCFFALTLCCTAGSMYGQVAQDSSKTIEKPQIRKQSQWQSQSQ